MSPGNPPGKYWFDSAPLVAKAIYQSTDGGIYHGPSVSPSKKYIRKLTVQVTSAAPLPMPMILCDYLLYYPTIDDGTTDPQNFTNEEALPRYSDETKEVLPIAVTTAPHTTGPGVTVGYESEAGGKATAIETMNTATAIGTISTSNTIGSSPHPFLSLAQGDSGVKQLLSAQMSKPDIGLFSLLLVRPLAQITINEATTVTEKDFFLSDVGLPEIKDDAFLGFLVNPTRGSLSGVQIRGDLQIVWD